MFFCFSLLTILLAGTTNAIQIKPSYGPPPQRLPHREYGVPQQMPFQEYGPPALKYGPPKLNFIGGGGSSSGLHEQIKNHYGAPKPFYGPPYKPQQQYGPPSQQFGPPLKPAGTYGPPPQKFQHKIPLSNGPPKPHYGPPQPQALPSFQPPPQFKPPHQPATSYGPPPSGPNQVYGPPPPPNYGPPKLPNFNHLPETTIIVTGGQSSQNSQSHQQQHQQMSQTQIQIDASGHTHSVAGSQAPFHTACDGWKPIPAPTGSYIENNHIDTQSGYSQVAQAQVHASSASSFSTTQYSGGATSGVGATGLGSTTLISGSDTGGNSIVDGLTDEQLVAVALQSSAYDADNIVQQQDILPSSGPAGDFNQLGLNSIEAEALQLSLGHIDDSYSKPPADSYAPGSKHSHNFNRHSNAHSSQSSFSLSGPGGNFAHPPPGGPGRRGPPRPPNANYGPPPLPPKGNYGPPLPPPLPLIGGNYGPPPISAHGPAPLVNNHAQVGLGIQYGKQTGNLVPFPPHGGVQPSKPVAYRPPVPQGLFETIGATVQHLDKFGVKPPVQAPTYIPPAANEIPHTGPGNLNIEYGAPQQQAPPNIIEQQLPQQRPAQVFVQIEQQQQQIHQQQQQPQQQNGEYGVPPPPQAQQGPQQPQYLPPPPLAQPQQAQYLPPPPLAQPQQAQYLPPAPLAQPQQQYLPPTGAQQQQQINGDSSYSSSASATFDSSAFATTQYNNQLGHAQSLPLPQQQPRFHNCGHGPNLLGAGNFNFQHQQQQNQYSDSSRTSISQSIPIAEQHTHFLSGPASSYGPPPSGGNDVDHLGYASEHSQVTALPDGTNPEGLPGLDGLDVLSAKKSEAIHFSSQEIISSNPYQVQFDRVGQDTANHEEILSADLLQKILNAVEQPQLQHQPLPANHKAESRSDIHIHENPVEAEADNENAKVKAYPNDDNLVETPADVQEVTPIVVKEEIARH